jgi:transcriptional regulator with XRE-family HTH domain
MVSFQMSQKNSFGSILRRLREEKQNKWIERKQWSQTAVARRIGVSRVAYIAWENDESLPSIDNLKRIVEVFRPDEKDERALYRKARQAPPRIHNLPPIQNLYFTGRKAYLKQLDQFFHEGKKLIFLYGPIGIGKTEVALRYAQLRYIDYTYSAVFWIDASDENTIQKSYDTLANLLGLPERSSPDPIHRTLAVNRWLEAHSRWLLIVDNMNAPEFFLSTYEVVTFGHTIITQRLPATSTIDIAAGINFGYLEPEEALLLLLRHAGVLSVAPRRSLDTVAPEVREPARQIAELLRTYTPALINAGKNIASEGMSFTEYLQLISEQTDNSGRVLKAKANLGASLLQEAGLVALPVVDWNELLTYVHTTWNTRIARRLVEQLTEQQMDELWEMSRAKNRATTLLWLNSIGVDYDGIINDEYDRLKAQLIQAAPQILAAYQTPTDKPSE